MKVEARTLLNKFGKIYEDMDYPTYRQPPQGTVRKYHRIYFSY